MGAYPWVDFRYPLNSAGNFWSFLWAASDNYRHADDHRLAGISGRNRNDDGVSVIFATGTIGILWRRLRKKPIAYNLLAGIIWFWYRNSHCHAGTGFYMPLENAMRVINSVALPVMLIYPVGTALLGVIIDFAFASGYDHTEEFRKMKPVTKS